MSNEKSSTKRYRNFATIIYCDSAPDDWLSKIMEHKVPFFVSPYHDRDINPGGELKKPHYHILIMYEGVKTIDQARDLISSFGGVGCEVIESLRGYARYLCHLDNPDKAQYSIDDVQCYFGSDYAAAISLVIDKYKAIREMIDYCNENGIISYATLLEYCAVHNSAWFRVLCDNGTMVIKEYLKSKSWTLGK